MLRYIFIWGTAGLVTGLLITLFMQLPSSHPLPPDNRTALQRDSYAHAVQIASPAVVSIKTLSFVKETPNKPPLDPLLERFFGQGSPHSNQFNTKTSLGSGVILSKDGLILTNYHVIANTREINVTLMDGRSVKAQRVGADPETDLALLKIELNNLPAIPLSNSDQLEVGDIVLAIGNPYGVGQTVTQGIISATGRNRVGLNTYENFIQTDAAINPGNSGGALINTRGELVAINSAIYSQSGAYQGISFSIPLNLALSVMRDLATHGQVVRGWLGVEGQDVNPEILSKIGLKDIKGVLITDVFKNSPADKAGLRVGDIITRIDDTDINDVRDVLNTIADSRPQQKVSIKGVRQMQSFNASAVLIQRPQLSN
ncbi:MAG: trypsin-like peptidase domain-containing protein [Gammaproteobacteria bacterium]|nr:trypsin-like peptidase domain-containing protein [Gammaproteobacteria bacterium]